MYEIAGSNISTEHRHRPTSRSAPSVPTITVAVAGSTISTKHDPRTAAAYSNTIAAASTRTEQRVGGYELTTWLRVVGPT
eukprot:974088-Rhodomonas_salina.2